MRHASAWIYIIGPAVTWLFNNFVTAAVSSLPAPTKDSTPKYVFWFQFGNRFVGNVQRAKSTSIEGSPNWQDAIQKHTELMAKIESPAKDSVPAPVSSGQPSPYSST